MKKEIKKENIKKGETSWEPVAGWYDDLLDREDTYQSKVILPNVLRLIPPERKRIIEIACGQGFFSKAYIEGGAFDVLGIDISPELIKIAKEGKVGAASKANISSGDSEIKKKPNFEVSPADKISPAESDYFDAALIILALQNIREMNETVKEAYRVLVKGGELLIVLNHPCFRIPKASAWGYDEKEKVQYRRVDRYGRPFSVSVDMTPGSKPNQEKIHTVSFHRPLQDYFKSLTNAGFSITGLEEWISHKKSEPGPRAEAEDNARKDFPMFLTIVAKK